MATWTDLKSFVGSGNADDTFVQQCWDTASELVNNFVGISVVPAVVKDRAVLMCGSELFHQRQAPNGIAQFTGFDGAPVRIARDPMTPAYAILNQYMVVGF